MSTSKNKIFITLSIVGTFIIVILLTVWRYLNEKKSNFFNNNVDDSKNLFGNVGRDSDRVSRDIARVRDSNKRVDSIVHELKTENNRAGEGISRLENANKRLADLIRRLKSSN